MKDAQLNLVECLVEFLIIIVLLELKKSGDPLVK